MLKNVTVLRKERAAALDAAKAIQDLCTKEKRDGTMDEIVALTAHLDRIDALDSEIAEQENLQARMSRAVGADDETTKHAAFEGARAHNRAEDEPFRNLGDMLICVRNAAVSPASTDPRLLRAALGASELIGDAGGFLVGKDVSGKLLEEMHEVGILARLCDEIPISSNSNAVTINGVDETSRADGSRGGGVQAYWADEAGTTTATKPKFRQMELKLKKLFALYYATDEVIQDAAALAAHAQRAFAEEMSFKVDDAIYRGTGAGQPLGVLNSPVVVTVNKETGQAADTVVFENIVKMYARMPARSKMRASWFINDDVFPQLQLMQLPGGTATTPVWLPPNGAASAPFGSLMGRPIIPIEHAATIGDLGDIMFADFSQYSLATKGGLQQASSIHVQFLTGEQVFRFTLRIDGQPSRSTPLTPYKGSATLSPFVILQAR